MNITNINVLYTGTYPLVSESLVSIASDLSIAAEIIDICYFDEHPLTADQSIVILDFCDNFDNLTRIIRKIRSAANHTSIAVVRDTEQSVPDTIRSLVSAVITHNDALDTHILHFILSTLDISPVKRQLIIMCRQIALNGNTDQFKQTADYLDDIAWILNTGTIKMIYVNPSMNHYIGLSVEESQSLSQRELFDNTSFAIISDFITQYNHQPQSRFIEYTSESTCKNGNKIHIKTAGYIFYDPHGVQCIAGISRKIEPHALPREYSIPEPINPVFADSPISIFIIDEGQIVYANNSAKHMLGLTCSDDLINTRFSDLFTKITHEYITSAHNSILNKGEFRHIHDATIRRIDDTIINTDIIAIKTEFNGKQCISVFVNDRSADIGKDDDRLFRSAVEHAPDAVLLLKGHTIVYCNQAAYTLFKVTHSAEVTGHRIYDLVHYNDVPRLRNRYDHYLSKGKRPPSEKFTYLAVDGSLLHVEATSTPFIYDNSTATLLFLKDVSLKKKAEEALLKSASYIEAIYRSTPSAIGLVSSGIICEANNQIFEMTGYTPPEIIDSPFTKLFPSHDEYARVRNKLQESSKSGKSEHFESVLSRKNGTLINVLFQGIHFPQSGNNCTYIFSALDITSRKITELKLAESETELKAIYESSPIIILLLDSSFAVRRANKAALDFAHVTEFIPGMHIEDIIRCNKFNRRDCTMQNRGCALKNILDDTLSNGIVFNSKEIILDITIDNISRQNTMYVSSQRTDIAGERMILMCIEDITENKRLIDTLQQIQKLDTIGKLAGGVAHDFNNILSALSLHVSLLLNDITITDRLRDEFTMMDTNIKRGINLTKKLLLFGRRETMKLTRIDINSLLSDLIKLLSRILGGNITINYTPSDHTAFINGDAGMIELAIINLCVNARDAMPQGGTITISTGLIDIVHPDICPVKSGLYSTITVEDNGIGLAEEEKKHIFDPFYTTKQYEIGTGLGLSVVYGIIKKHHGHITATSEKERGTRFDILIPYNNGEMEP